MALVLNPKTEPADEELRSALEFVIRSIKQQAERSGDPLSEDQKQLLCNLPSTSTRPLYVDTHSPMLLAPQDHDFGMLCTLAASAHAEDVAVRPEAAAEWELAGLILMMRRHPMAWLLEWAGIRAGKTWQDRLLLVLTAVSVIPIAVLILLVLRDDTHSVVGRVLIATGSAGIAAGLALAAKRLGRWRIERLIENCRRQLGGR